MLTRYLPGKYIDFENGTCCFDNEDFKELILNIKKGNENYNASNELSSYLNNEAILYAWDINSFYSLDEYEAVFRSTPVIVGYPDEIQNYNILCSANPFGILSCSDNSTGAFDFIKFYTSYDYQIENEDMFPVNRQAFEDIYNYYITCEDEMSTYIPNENINAQYKCTQENADKIIALIVSSNHSNSIGLTLTEMIADEITPCITEEKNIDDACSALQGRAELFLSESVSLY